MGMITKTQTVMTGVLDCDMISNYWLEDEEGKDTFLENVLSKLKGRNVKITIEDISDY